MRDSSLCFLPHLIVSKIQLFHIQLVRAFFCRFDSVFGWYDLLLLSAFFLCVWKTGLEKEEFGELVSRYGVADAARRPCVCLPERRVRRQCLRVVRVYVGHSHGRRPRFGMLGMLGISEGRSGASAFAVRSLVHRRFIRKAQLDSFFHWRILTIHCLSRSRPRIHRCD